MDKLRVFTTFKGSVNTRSPVRRPVSRGPQEAPSQQNTGPTAMRERSLENKPYKSREEILQKLEEAKNGTVVKKSKKVEGQRFGDGFMNAEKAAEAKVKTQAAADAQEKKQVAEKAVREASESEELPPGVVKEAPVPSDVSKNDPNDPMTTEKLKSILSSGAINFSGKEQKVLAQILGT